MKDTKSTEEDKEEFGLSRKGTLNTLQCRSLCSLRSLG